MTATNRVLLLCCALSLPACRAVDSACERVEEISEAEGKKISNVACQIRVRKLKGAERDAMIECLNGAEDLNGFRTCLQ